MNGILPMNGDGLSIDNHGIQHEAIALVGMGCRLPGQVTSPSELWKLLKQNKSGHCDVPESRYNAGGFYHPDAGRPGSINSMGGYFLQEDVRSFDNAFFGINNLEATYMDAQQRKLLEVVYESFENGGVPLSKIYGSRTGVYIGNFTNDYMIMQYKDPEYFSRYSATGSGPTVLSNRITHCFDLRGPSVVLDTACSSSLYALHFACLALDAHDCDAAVVASANLIQSAEQQLIAVKAGILSPDATCHTFDESANGYGRADGISSLYLKRLSDAQRDGDTIRCVIRGTAINGNGRTPGIVQPSVDGQEAVIRRAYKRAGLPTDETDYLECHGTGTRIGDPIELEGISRVFRHKTGIPTAVGGIKPNLGHSEGASGISSIIKVALALEHKEIPATIGVKNINPNIKLDEWHLDIVRENRPWPQSNVARASVNSFGFGGANGHAILEAAPEQAYPQNVALATTNGHVSQSNCHDDTNRASSKVGPTLLAFSARSEHSLQRMVKDTANYVFSAENHVSLGSLARTLNGHRSRLTSRGFLIAHTETLVQDLDPANLFKNSSRSEALPITFIFTGQGAQWPGMGCELLHHYPRFRETIRYLDLCLATLDPEFKPHWTLEHVLLSPTEESDIHLANKSQPICTAVQIALVDLLMEWNIMPKVAIGHSSGEIGAAYATGSLSAYQAIMAAYFRGHTVSRFAQKGSMMAIGIGIDAAQAIIDEHRLSEDISLACDNSPESTTVSGDSDAVEKLLQILQGDGIFSRKLKTDGKAYHSKHMKDVAQLYQESLDQVWNRGPPQRPNSKLTSVCNKSTALGQKHPDSDCRVRVISSVTGAELDNERDMSTTQYWRANLESRVRFREAVESLLRLGRQYFIELGPHSALELPIKQNVDSENRAPGYYTYSSALVRGKNAGVTILSLAGSLFLHGHDHINLVNTLPETLIRESQNLHILTDLPSYPWDYTAPLLWTEPRAVSEFRNRPFPRHDLLGSQIPGASKRTTMWRNIVDIHEVPWLKDHCLGPSIVFPAAAYLAMAVEAICQVNGIFLQDCPGVEMRQFNFLKAMDFHIEQRPRLEVITEMRRAPVSGILSSSTWWELNVSSISGEHPQAIATVHATGLVSMAEMPRMLPRTIRLDENIMEQQATRVWYEKFTREGLNWGPEFAVMEGIFCDQARQAQVAKATTHLIRGENSGVGSQDWQYIAHPISIDSMLQTAFVATTGGWVRKLRATVPVKMDKISFSAPAPLDMDIARTWTVDAKSKRVGFGTVNIEAELFNASGDALVRMEGVRCIAYQGNTQQERHEKRSPMCRVAWKPDISLMEPGPNAGLTKYTDWTVNNFKKMLGVEQTMVTPELLMRLAGALDLFAHRTPTARILLLLNGVDDAGTEACRNLFLRVLNADSPHRRFETFSQATWVNEELHGYVVSPTQHTVDTSGSRILKDTKFNLIISPDVVPAGAQDWMALSSSLITGKAVEKGVLSMPSRATTITETTDEPISITMFCEVQQQEPLNPKQKRDIVMVKRTSKPSTLEVAMHKVMELHFACQVRFIMLSEVCDETVPSRAIVISTVESDVSLLSTVCETEMRHIKTLTNRASLILWVCHADFMAGTNPEFAPVAGLSRAVMLEQPALQFAIFDVDDTMVDVDLTANNACKVLHRLMTTADPELELSQKQQVIHSIRWEPHDELNSQFRLKQEEGLIEIPIENAGRCTLHISSPGQMDTVHFVSEERPKQYDAKPLPTDYVDIQVKSVGINAKDIYVLSAKVDTHNVSCSCECAGVVVNVGSEVRDLQPGDRVVAMAPGHFATHEQFPRWAVLKLNDDEDFTTASTIPIVFSTAIYGLQYRANLQRGESILIHSAAGGVGLAAIQLAQYIGAEIFTTVGNELKKNFLVEEFGLDPARIFSSRDDSFLSAIMAATDGQGVDVVLNSLTGELLRSSFEACADFGRFIEIGKRDILDDGLLSMANFGKNVSLMAFDLSNLFYSKKLSHQHLWHKLLEESMSLIRNGDAKPCKPIATFRASDITKAFRHFSLGTRIGKVTVSFEDVKDRILVKPSRYETTFSPNKTYLMVGCLGGLGRSISKWMVSRGAKNLVFLGRSGLSKPEARLLVADLTQRGAQIEVFQGDVAVYEDVERAIQQAPLPIGGVIHAAMGLSESLWSSMRHASWHTSIAPKVRGSWNLHHALAKEGRDAQLDFFILTSSISGTVGTATESNYCAANSFLDAFARYRNRLGRPAISIGYGMIAEVGYLHEHPEIEALLKRKGIQSINEDELLQILDLAMLHQSPSTWVPHYDGFVGSHILTGIEFTRLKQQRDRGFEGDNHVLADPRASLFAAAYERSTRTSRSRAAPEGGGRLPAEVAKALASEGSDISVVEAVQAIVAYKIANLILLPAEQLQPDQKLGEFGIDSMLAAEFRTSIFHALEVDIPFMTLLDKETSVRSLTEIIVAGLQERE